MNFDYKAILKGIATSIDIAGENIYNPLENISSNPSAADYHALKSDWEAIGSDIKSAIKKYQHKLNG